MLKATLKKSGHVCILIGILWSIWQATLWLTQLPHYLLPPPAKVFESFLEWYKSALDTSQIETRDSNFRKDCDLMYGQKTLSRLKKMENTTLDKISNINGTKVKPIKDLLRKINWDDLYTKLKPSKFHGDLQLENIIYSTDNKFILIDWRQTFGNNKKVGDLYYDLGKIWHSLPINGKSVLNEM